MRGFTEGQVRMTLPDDSAVRKTIPMFRGLLMYFPAALAGAASHSQGGNDKHNPGEELHHARGKSSDHGDCIIRHMVDIADMQASVARGEYFYSPEAILAECNALVWRACAFSQEAHETLAGAPLAPAARLPAGWSASRYSPPTAPVVPVDLTKFDGLKDGDEFEFQYSDEPERARVVRGRTVQDESGCIQGGVEDYVYQKQFIRYTKKAPR